MTKPIVTDSSPGKDISASLLKDLEPMQFNAVREKNSTDTEDSSDDAMSLTLGGSKPGKGGRGVGPGGYSADFGPKGK